RTMPRTVKLIAITYLLAACNEGPDERISYSRSDCLVRVAIESTLDSAQKELALRKIPELVFDSSVSRSYEGPHPGLGINDDRDSMFVQFPWGCESRLAWASTLIENVIAPEMPEGIRFRVTDEIVQPGPETIQIYGSAWTDGEPPSMQVPGVTIDPNDVY